MDQVESSLIEELLENFGFEIFSYKEVVAVLLQSILPEEFFDLDLTEIVDKYLPSSDSDPNKIKILYTQNPFYGKFAQFQTNSPSGRKYIISIGSVKNYSGFLKLRAAVYDSDTIEKYPPENYLTFYNLWNDSEPCRDFVNSIIVTDKTTTILTQDYNAQNNTLIEEYSQLDGLQRLVQIYLGGPEYPKFKYDVKFFYALFHNDETEIKNFYENNNIKVSKEILKSMKEFTKSVQQAKELCEKAVLNDYNEITKEVYERALSEGLDEDMAKKIAYGS